MAKTKATTIDEILSHFSFLEDPREEINRKHPFRSVLVIALMAVLAGAAGPTGITRWAELKKDLLSRVLDLPNGVPSKDVFRRVLMALNPQAFQLCFEAWVNSLREKAGERMKIDQPILAVDGKTLRRSHDEKKGLGALHLVSVWCGELGLSLGQVACEEKSNEITAIPELLGLVNVEGAIVTIDAMGTQKAIAELIVEKKGDYVLALKGNQEKLHRAVIDYIDQQSVNGFEGIETRQFLSEERGHGREEGRAYIQMRAPKELPGFELWKGLKTLGVVVSQSVRKGQEVISKRYFISSLDLGVRNFARAVRGHWSVENGCHWILDVQYREDESRIREANLRENFAWLNRFSLSLLKQHKKKDSVAMKRRCCGWDDAFLLQVLTGKDT
ncbi:ISAs1 family transposase [Telmatocola sphagniphila]|uniref:ISAs1 family transposase n=1 Tax=Telmatocola sphagniphila TaxID=1123043 RepID=A0A8E6BB04_9BACT|nr:ISAs1 family transposase [Telmatocola sphagniphila]QVL33843.1 ISAs1 family transposase [Telmatocola sphagniphila]